MDSLMVFNTVIYDIQPLSGESGMAFFAESADNEESVTSNTEEQILKWILTHRSLGKFLVSQFFEVPSTVKAYLGLTDPFVESGRKPGDIDLLLIDPAKPDRSIAFEVKRVKAVATDDEVSRVNGAEKIRKGVIQVNKYQSLGFHQTYLMVIVLNDARTKRTPNVALRKANSSNVQRVFGIPWNEPLHADVGIVYVEITQFTGRAIAQTGSFGVCIDKRASMLEQASDFTTKVKKLSSQPNRHHINFN